MLSHVQHMEILTLFSAFIPCGHNLQVQSGLLCKKYFIIFGAKHVKESAYFH